MNISELVRLARTAGPPTDWLASISATEAHYPDDRIYYYRFLYWAVHTLQPQIAIELGVDTGIASAHMMEAAASYGGKVIGIDHNRHGFPADELTQRYQDQYIFVHGDTTKSIDKVRKLSQGQFVQFVFQDSSHHYIESLMEWRLYSRLMYDGVWVCHDVTPAFYDPLIDPPGRGMVEYFNELPGEKTLLEGLHVGNAVGVIWGFQSSLL